jgi:hypothetical protein
MPVAARNKVRHYRPKLRKRFVAAHEGHDVYEVDSSAVRNLARPDEEFGNFATRDEFPDLIPEGQIWMSRKTLDKEAVFFMANALARFKKLAEGAPEDRAYTAGLNAELALREKVNGVKLRDGNPHRRVPQELYVEPYVTLLDKEFPIEVWLVDGNLVRSWYKTDYTEGGHGYVYRWVPKQQIWVEKDLDRWELPFIVSHEYVELRLMRDEGIDYDHAHDVCSRMEFSMRKGKGVNPLLVPGRRRFAKRELPKLARDEVLQYVLKTYVRK